jgi:phage/plasmid-associated DNA primase
MFDQPTKKLIKEFGPPGFKTKNGLLTELNETFWAAYYASQKQRIILEPQELEFYDFGSDSGIYDPKSTDKIRFELSALLLACARTWPSWSQLQRFRSASQINRIIEMLRGYIEERDFFNQNQCYAHLGNCTLNFAADGSGFTVESFTSDHRCRNRSPIHYDAKATCPEFEQRILSHVSPDDRVLLQKYAGQCLIGRNLVQRFIVLDGIGSASKSAFVLTIAAVIGLKNVYELRTMHLHERFEIGRMIGRTLLIGSDVQGSFLSAPGAYRIKSLVGGDPLEAEKKGSNHRFTVMGRFNLMITSNTRLCIYLDSDDTAWERRLAIVRYDTPFTGQRIFDIDQYLLNKEAPGILNWCINGGKLLFQDYAKAGDIILSSTQQKRVSDLLAESDSLRIFVSNNIVRDDGKMGNGESYSLTTQEIIDEYVADCVQDKNWVPLSASTVEKRLPALMLRYFGSAKTNSLKRANRFKRGFWNVRFH